MYFDLMVKSSPPMSPSRALSTKWKMMPATKIYLQLRNLVYGQLYNSTANRQIFFLLQFEIKIIFDIYLCAYYKIYGQQISIIQLQQFNNSTVQLQIKDIIVHLPFAMMLVVVLTGVYIFSSQPDEYISGVSHACQRCPVGVWRRS